MPDARFLDRPKELLDHAVLFRSIGRDKLLGEGVGLHLPVKALLLKTNPLSLRKRMERSSLHSFL